MLSSASDDCISSCPENEIMINKIKCVSSSDAKIECAKYKMSSDSKSCSTNCLYPDFSDTDKTCKSIKNCSSDSTCCKDNSNETVLDFTSLETSCSTKPEC